MRRRWSDRSSRRVRTLVTQLARSRLVRESGRMRADIHDGPEQTLQSEAGYSNARPRQPSRRNLLQRTAGPYSWVKSDKTHVEHNESASLIGRLGSSAFRLSTTAVSMSLTGSRFSSESAPRPFHHGIRGRGGAISYAALRQTSAGPGGLTNSPHPSSREGHHSTARWSSSFLLSGLILPAHAAAASLVHRNSEPSTHMRCMTTANRRARATIAFFIPRRLAICIAQALSQDHLMVRVSMT